MSWALRGINSKRYASLSMNIVSAVPSLCVVVVFVSVIFVVVFGAVFVVVAP